VALPRESACDRSRRALTCAHRPQLGVVWTRRVRGHCKRTSSGPARRAASANNHRPDQPSTRPPQTGFVRTSRARGHREQASSGPAEHPAAV